LINLCYMFISSQYFAKITFHIFYFNSTNSKSSKHVANRCLVGELGGLTDVNFEPHLLNLVIREGVFEIKLTFQPCYFKI